MKKILLLAMLTLAAHTALAEKGDRLKVGEIKFDSADFDKVTQTNILVGNVVLTQGTLVMKADKATVRDDVDGNQYVTLTAAPNSAATFRQKRDGGPDLWVEGQAQRIEYDGEKELLKLFSGAKLKELEAGKVMKAFDSEYIAYDSRKEIVAARNDVSGESKPGKGRGTLILQPRLPKPGAAAPATSTGKQ
jgi:lipopolysaccharide export system protein LptA